MNIATVTLVASLGLSAIAPALAEEPSTHETDRARKAVSELAASLRNSLGDALSAGGPVGALAACQIIAPEAARSQSAAHKLTIRRTALRVRNTDNAPDAYERAGLKRFLAQIADGADPAKLELVEMVVDGDAKSLRYMKPIMMAEKPCGACHGSAIGPEVRARISELYPHDEATGFAPGEMRGAFSVVIPQSVSK